MSVRLNKRSRIKKLLAWFLLFNIMAIVFLFNLSEDGIVSFNLLLHSYLLTAIVWCFLFCAVWAIGVIHDW